MPGAEAGRRKPSYRVCGFAFETRFMRCCTCELDLAEWGWNAAMRGAGRVNTVLAVALVESVG